MARIIISHLAPAVEPEIRFLCDLAEGFERHGHKSIIWSGIYDKSFAPYYLPLSWRIKEWPSFYEPGFLDGDADAAYALIDVDKWRERVYQLPKQEWEPESREELLDNLIRVGHALVTHFKPDLFLSWNTLCPHTGVAHDMCQALGIPAMLIERAVFPSTWFVQEGGLLGLSPLAGVDIDALIPQEQRAAYREVGRSYLEQVSFGKYNRYAQVQESPKMDQLRQPPFDALRPRIVMFPPDDGTLGFVPADGADRKATAPHYLSSFDATKQLAYAHDGLTIFKPHPSFLERSFAEHEEHNLFVVDYDFRKLIEWADIVATTGSGLEFIAMAMDKPVLLMGNDILAGKRIAYEAIAPDQIARAVDEAYRREGFEERKERFYEYCGYLMKEALASASDGYEYRPPLQVADELCARYLADAPPEEAPGAFAEERAEALERRLRNKLRVHSAELEEERAAPLTGPSESRGALLHHLRVHKTNHIVLDFDYTLYKNNSTDSFLDTVRPRLLAYFLVVLSDTLTRNLHRWRVLDYNDWRDYFRVLFVSVCFPWALILWRLTARKRMETFCNHELAEAVRESGPEQVTVISFGYRHLIGPLMKHVDLGVAPRLICSRIGVAFPNLRRAGRGKGNAIRPHLRPDQLSDALFVTDSKDDRELLGYIPRSFLVQWGAYFPKPFAGLYFPLRYMLEGKYSRRRYFWNQLMKEDFAVLLLAYAWNAETLLTLPFLFLAFMVIYEIGYYTNDHEAAKKERKPSVTRDARAFENYPIWKAWLWSPLFILIATFIRFPGAWERALRLAPEAIREGSVDKALQIALHLDPVALFGLTWVAVLFALRLLFALFNSTVEIRRVYLFPFLHLMKTFSYALLLPVTALGSLALASQALTQTQFYNMYRHRADISNFNRQAYRFVFFVMLLVAASACWLKPGEVLRDPRLYAIAAWCVYRGMEREYGGGPIGMAKGLARHAWRVLGWRVKRLLGRS